MTETVTHEGKPAGSETDIPERGNYSEIISQLRWFGAKRKWPKGLEGMPALLSGVADILQGYSLECEHIWGVKTHPDGSFEDEPVCTICGARPGK